MCLMASFSSFLGTLLRVPARRPARRFLLLVFLAFEGHQGRGLQHNTAEPGSQRCFDPNEGGGARGWVASLQARIKLWLNIPL